MNLQPAPAGSLLFMVNNTAHDKKEHFDYMRQ